ncbi:MAG TPA: hypothetical protein PKE55_08320 [Kiritimatiellia bacterium]|nr:hypothetical protein [Kiritimatiellia bacterium]
MKPYSLLLAAILAFSSTLTVRAQTVAELAENPAALSGLVAESTVEQAAGLLASVLIAIEGLDIDDAEKVARMEGALAAVFGAFEGREAELAAALGTALGFGSAVVAGKVERLLDAAGIDASGFAAAVANAAGGGDAFSPPVLDLSPASPPPPVIPPPAGTRPPRRPPIAPPYQGQLLP